MKLHRLQVTPERHRLVLRDISDGSQPEMRFYILVTVSTLVASFGLITNSTAVIIGAMLLAPLMTPIFGIALALIRGDTPLFGKAVQAEIAGVVAAILMSFILGRLYPALEPTPEMLARTRPQLFDLLVAVFSGFAGAYALVDEKISPAGEVDEIGKTNDLDAVVILEGAAEDFSAAVIGIRGNDLRGGMYGSELGGLGAPAGAGIDDQFWAR